MGGVFKRLWPYIVIALYSHGRRFQALVELSAPLLQLVVLVWLLIVDLGFPWISELIAALKVGSGPEMAITAWAHKHI